MVANLKSKSVGRLFCYKKVKRLFVGEENVFLREFRNVSCARKRRMSAAPLGTEESKFALRRKGLQDAQKQLAL